jgi:hypothetical protein
VKEPCPETVRLRLPADARYATVARIVVGGLAARLNLSYETLDDVQLAVELLLAEEHLLADDQVTLDLDVLDRALAIAIGPIDVEAARARLDGAGDLPLQVTLAAVVDETVVDDMTETLRLRKNIPVLQRD